jgi:hypothetical protein
MREQRLMQLAPARFASLCFAPMQQSLQTMQAASVGEKNGLESWIHLSLSAQPQIQTACE